MTYVSMISELKEMYIYIKKDNLANPMTGVSMVSELKEIKNFSKACDLCVYGQRAERNKNF